MTNNKQIYGQMNKKLIVGFAIILCIFQVSATNLWTENLNDGLVAYYNLDEIGGANVLDSVGNNNGTNNGADYGTNGIINKSMSFSGGDYVDVGNVDLDLISSPITINAWINMSDLS